MPRNRKGRFTAERTTTVTERVTIETHHDTSLEPLPHFAGPSWDGHTMRNRYREQRATQVGRCADFLALWDASAEPGATVPDRLIAEAAIILRAGPGATPLELTLGRIA